MLDCRTQIPLLVFKYCVEHGFNVHSYKDLTSALLYNPHHIWLCIYFTNTIYRRSVIIIIKIKKKLDNSDFFSIIVTILTINIICKLIGGGTMVTRKNAKKYKTNEICARFDISRATLFRWESDGLLSGVQRDWRGWRVYSQGNLREIEKIIKGKNTN